MIISISGTIGVGKSTLCQNLSSVTGFPVSDEPVDDNPYLTDFYGDPSKWCFQNQVFILSTLYALHREFIKQGSHKSLLLDRSFYEGKIFVDVLRDLGHFSCRDYATYLKLYRSLIDSTAPIDLVVYLKISPEEALDRIQSRGRESEKAINLDYLSRLDDAYERWIGEMSVNTRVKTLNWKKFGSPEAILDIIGSSEV